MALARYKTYKDSGVEWIGKIPENWNIKRAKDLSVIFVPQRDKPNLIDKGYTPWVTTDFLSNKYIDAKLAKYYVAEEEIKNKKIRKVPKNSILTSCVGELGLTAINKTPVVINQQIQAYSKIKKLDVQFLNYLIQSITTRTYFEKFASETTIRYLNKEKFGLTPFIFPSLTHQISITNYLNKKTTLIDRKITLLQEKVDKYEALKKTLINETVCRGLDKSVKMKDSGVEWIGEIPKHWKILRIKDFTYVKGRIGWQGLRSDEFVDNTEFLCITGTDFKHGKIDWENCYCIEEDRFNQDSKIHLRKGDILITKDGTIGKIALVDELPKKATLNSGVFVTRPLKNKYENEFMFWFLNSSAFRNYIDYTKNGSTILHLYQNVFERFLYVLPPIEEQLNISKYLNKKTTLFTQIIINLQIQIQTLKELRKTLINDVVTGKLKVT